MFQNYEIMFVVGAFGLVISFILLLISVIKNVKKLKIVSIIFIAIFVVIFSIGISLGYFYYENSKNVMSQVDDTKSDIKVTSGNIEDPIVITEKAFFADDLYYYGEFTITNNTNIEISKISFHIQFTYKDAAGNGSRDEPIFLLDSVIPPRKTVIENYIWRKNAGGKKVVNSDIKLSKIQNIVSYVNINNEEKRINLEDLNTMLKNN